MAQLKPLRAKLRLLADGGEVGGKAKTIYYNFSDVKHDADPINLLMTANAIADVIKHPLKLKSYEKVDEITSG